MSTPEGAVKTSIKRLLEQFKIYPASKAGAFPADAQGWYYMPHQGGLGVKGIPDFIGCYRGLFWAVEAKAPGKVPSGFQALQIEAIQATTALCLVVDGPETLDEFRTWLSYV